MRVHTAFAALALAVPAFTGCAARLKPATNWQLREQVLIPPQPPAGVVINLKHARSRAGSHQCGVTLPEIQLAWKGRDARVTLRPDVTAGPATVPIVSAGDERSVGVPVRDLSWWSSFQGALEARENEGCLGSGDAALVSARVVEHLAVPSGLAYQLRYGNSGSTGYLDLSSEFALRWMTPKLKPGVAHYSGPKDVDSYETMTYKLKPRSGGGVKLELESVEHNVKGQFTYDKHSTAEPLSLPDSVRFIRYFFRTWKATDSRRIAILAAKRRNQLDALTRRFEADPEGFCGAVRASEAVCLAVPNESILVPEVEVRTNGKPAWVPVGGTLADALGRAKVKADPQTLATLTVLRPWSGQLLPVEFDRTRADILRLVLIGGESIRW